jgi:hypothetical protein
MRHAKRVSPTGERGARTEELVIAENSLSERL